MRINEILREKYRVQKHLSERCENIHDYFAKSHKSAEATAKKYGIILRYEKLPEKPGKHVGMTTLEQ